MKLTALCTKFPVEDACDAHDHGIPNHNHDEYLESAHASKVPPSLPARKLNESAVPDRRRAGPPLTSAAGPSNLWVATPDVSYRSVWPRGGQDRHQAGAPGVRRSPLAGAPVGSDEYKWPASTGSYTPVMPRRRAGLMVPPDRRSKERPRHPSGSDAPPFRRQLATATRGEGGRNRASEARRAENDQLFGLAAPLQQIRSPDCRPDPLVMVMKGVVCPGSEHPRSPAGGRR